MSGYWGTRMRRGVWTKNWHWYAANAARFGNFLAGNGFRTGAEIAQDNERESRKAMKAQGVTRAFRPVALRDPSPRGDGSVKPVRFDHLKKLGFRPVPLKSAGPKRAKLIKPTNLLRPR